MMGVTWSFLFYSLLKRTEKRVKGRHRASPVTSTVLKAESVLKTYTLRAPLYSTRRTGAATARAPRRCFRVWPLRYLTVGPIFRERGEGIQQWIAPPDYVYCLSYTMVKPIGLPSASVPFDVFVMVLPSLLMTVLPVVWYFPPVFLVSLVKVFASSFNSVNTP
jgi:hypothetical protein